MDHKHLLPLMILLTVSAPAPSAESALKARILIHQKSHWLGMRFRETENFDTEKIKALMQKRDGVIADLTRSLRETKTDPARTDLGIRLGRLYREKFYLEIQVALHEVEPEVAEAKTAKDLEKKQGLAAESLEARTALDHAIDEFGDLARNKQNPRRDQILFYYATSNLERGNTDRAMDAFQKLASEFPKSPFVVESYAELGDHELDGKHYSKAEAYYDQLISRKYEPLLTYALYKKAWCAYNTNRKDMALQLFKRVILTEETLAGTRMKMRSEALHDIGLVFVDLHRYNDALAFFQAFPEPEYRRGLETMAQLFSDQGDHALAINLWENLLSLDSTYAKAPEYELQIVACLDRKNDRRAAVHRLQTKVALYLPGGEWASANPLMVAAAGKSFAEAMRTYALGYHLAAQKRNNEEDYDLARSLYASFLERFPKSEVAGLMHYNLAEIQAKDEHFAEAAGHYAEAYRALPEGGSKEEALRRALGAYGHEVNRERKEKGLAEISARATSRVADEGELYQPGSAKPTAYSVNESKLLALSEESLKKYPGAKDFPETIYRQSFLEYQHRDFDKARAGFATILARYSSHATAYGAARLTLDMMGRTDDAAALIAQCKGLLTNPGLTNAAFRNEVGALLRKTELKRIQAMEDDNKFKMAADAYVEYIKGYGYQDESLFEKALYNAAADYGRAGDFESQVETLERFLRRFPKSRLAQGVLLQNAKAYEEIANFEKAAPLFEKYAAQYPKDAQAKSALRLAGLYYWGSGNARAAEKALKAFLDKYPKDAAPVEEELMKVYASMGAVAKAIHFQTAARAELGDEHPIESLTRLMRIIDLKAQKSGRVSPKLMEEALELAQDHKGALLKAPRGIEMYSRLLFWQAEQDEARFYSLRISHAKPAMDQELAKKVDALRELEASYAAIAALGSPRFGTGALAKTAAAYRQLALDVERAPVPTDLSGKALDAYREELTKNDIAPNNEKAMTFAQRCLDKADDLKALSPWTSHCYSVMSGLDAKRFPKVHTFYLPPLQTALLVPTVEDKKVPAGNTPTFAFPFLSSGLFGNLAGMSALPERGVAVSAPIENLPLADTVATAADESGVMPVPTSYRALTEKRKEALSQSLEAAAPKEKEAPSFAYLNLLRLLRPESAVAAVHSAIKREPKSPALHNLLGLAYLEVHNLSAAKVTWLSMVARNEAGPAVWNNLGVVSSLEGDEEAALGYFNKAAENDGAKEALVNLGFLALKYRNGSEAARNFDRVLASASDMTVAQVGSWEASVQQGRFEEAQDSLEKFSQEHRDDPYARLASSYFLMEVENQATMAKQLLSTYIEAESLENDVQFRRALNQARQLSSSGGALPAVEE